MLPFSEDTSFFWFFGADNVELVVKVLDGTAFNDHYWVFFGALSDVQYDIDVRDRLTGEVKTYSNAQGNICGQSDTLAFASGVPFEPGLPLPPDPPQATNVVSNRQPEIILMTRSPQGFSLRQRDPGEGSRKSWEFCPEPYSQQLLQPVFDFTAGKLQIALPSPGAFFPLQSNCDRSRTAPLSALVAILA